MRIACLILALLLTYQLALPCADERTDCKASHELDCQADPDEDTESAHTDECSPFCTCHCCHSYSPYAEASEPAARQSYQSHGHPHCRTFPTTFNWAIWQPPQLSA